MVIIVRVRSNRSQVPRFSVAKSTLRFQQVLHRSKFFVKKHPRSRSLYVNLRVEDRAERKKVEACRYSSDEARHITSLCWRVPDATDDTLGARVREALCCIKGFAWRADVLYKIQVRLLWRIQKDLPPQQNRSATTTKVEGGGSVATSTTAVWIAVHG